MSRLTGNPVYFEVARDIATITKGDNTGPFTVIKTKKYAGKVEDKHFGEWKRLAGETDPAGIERIYRLLCATYNSKVQNSIENLVTDKDELGPARDIQGPSCVPVKIKPPFSSVIPYSNGLHRVEIYRDLFLTYWLKYRLKIECDSTPMLCDCDEYFAWLDSGKSFACPSLCTHPFCIKARLDLETDGTALDHMRCGFVSGGTSDGLLASLRKSVRSTVKPNVHPQYVVTALAHIASQIPKPTLVPEFSRASIDSLHFNPKSSAGYMPVEPTRLDIEDIIIDYINTCKQGDAYHYCKERLMKIVNQVQEGVANKYFDPNWFPLLISKISAKVELKKKGDDPMKTRIIFIACMVHLLCDKLLYSEYVQSSYMRGGNMISHKWKHGGATYIANKFGYMREDMFYFTTDIVNFDQSAFACLISLILLLPLWLMDDDGSTNYKIARAFYIQRAHEMAVKVVKWTHDEFRLIVGQIFSGLYVTSWLDTIYMLMADNIVKQMLFHKATRVHGQKYARDFQSSFMPTARYGDDSVNGFMLKYLDFVCNNRTEDFPLGDYQRIMESAMGLKFKISQTKLFLPTETYSNPFLTRIAKKYDDDGNYIGHTILHDGPEFLHRRFVKVVLNGKTEIVPWRHESDYFARMAISANATSLHFAKWSSKYLGLMIDTMATNMVAFEACRHMYLHSLQYVEGMVVNGESIARTFDKKDEKLTKILYQLGINEQQATAGLNPQNLFHLFTWDEQWRNAWASLYRLPLYDPYGTAYEPTWLCSEHSPLTYLASLGED